VSRSPRASQAQIETMLSVGARSLRFKSAQNDTNSLASRFDLAFSAAHALCVSSSFHFRFGVLKTASANCAGQPN